MIVISNPGASARAACATALAIRNEVEGDDDEEHAITIRPYQKSINWSVYAAKKIGFNYDLQFDSIDEYEGEVGHENMRGFVGMTEIMSKRLTGGFIFSLYPVYGGSSRCPAVSPIIYGGYASDGSIVGVLASCVSPSGPLGLRYLV